MDKDSAESFRMICRLLASGTRLTYVAIGIGLLVAFFSFSVFFGDVSGFVEDVDNATTKRKRNSYSERIAAKGSGAKIFIWIHCHPIVT